MHRVGAGKVGSGLDLGPVDHLVQSWHARVGGGVDQMNVVRSHAGQQQIVARHRPIVKSGRTGVPAHVVQFIPDAGHLKTADHLGIGGAYR